MSTPTSVRRADGERSCKQPRVGGPGGRARIVLQSSSVVTSDAPSRYTRSWCKERFSLSLTLMLQFCLPNKTAKFRVIGVEPCTSQKKTVFPYLLRALTFEEPLPRAHLSDFLYSSITFAFLLVIVSFGTLVHETNWKIFFKTIFFKKKKKKRQDSSKPQRRTGPPAALGSGAGKAKAGAEAAKRRCWLFIWKA